MSAIFLLPLQKAVVVLLSVLMFTGGTSLAEATVSINKDEQSVVIVTDTGTTKVKPWSGGTIRGRIAVRERKARRPD